jgi:O-antigen/teichoic acid export membrane protein
MNPLKKLAGETAIYGISSIVGRVLNYLLVPLYTTVFMEGEYGVITKLYAYVAFLNIIYTYGMETAFFRYASQGDLLKTYQQCAGMILMTSTLFSGIILIGAPSIAVYLEIPGQVHLVRFLAGILFIDAVSAIPFARLRLENKALTFALAKLAAIAITIGLNLMFLLLPYLVIQKGYLPGLEPSVVEMLNPAYGVGYVFLANLLGNAMIILILRKYFLQIRFNTSWHFAKPLLKYGLPIFLMGLAGIANEQADKLMIPALLPDNFYPGKSSMAALGIYGASFKLSIFMLLAIQAFRYAGEPFFFSHAKNKQAPELFAKVMYYFVVICVFILLAVGLNIELLGQIFLRQPSYREALYLVPILLFGKLLFGIYINLSVWFKLVDKTLAGTYISLLGAGITVLVNWILIPIIGYTGAAIASVACYGTMSFACWNWGRKHFPIPYKWLSILGHLTIGVVVIYLASSFRPESNFLYHLFNMGVPMAYLVVVALFEKRNSSLKMP